MGVLQQATNGASSANVHSLLEKLRNRELVVQLPKGAINAEGYGEECWPVNRNVLKDLLHQVDGLLPNSWLELQAIRNDLNWHGETFEIAHYGVDPALFLDPDPRYVPAKQPASKRPSYFQAGRIEPAKKPGHALLGSARDESANSVNWSLQALARICGSLQEDQRR